MSANEIDQLRAENETLRNAQKACATFDKPTAQEVIQLRTDKEKLESELLRVTDLVRFQRAELHQADLITDEEYAELCAIKDSPARLEDYDAMRERAEKAEAACAQMRERLEELRELSHWLDNEDEHQTKAIDVVLSTTCGQGYVSEKKYSDLVAAATDLWMKIQYIHTSPLYLSVWHSAATHGIDYTNGPKYETELAALGKELARLKKRVEDKAL